MKLWNHYHTPQSIDEAVQLLSQYDGAARIVAGGTDLLVDMRAAGEDPHEALIDITTIPELRNIEAVDGSIVIGSGLTHTAVVKSQSVSDGATCLIVCCGLVGGPQVRNVATLGGNVAHALPAGDGTTSLVALAAEAEVAGPSGRAWRPMAAMFAGPGKTTLAAGELIVQFRFAGADLAQREATAFKRI